MERAGSKLRCYNNLQLERLRGSPNLVALLPVSDKSASKRKSYEGVRTDVPGGFREDVPHDGLG
jgi:hypothetical protein